MRESSVQRTTQNGAWGGAGAGSTAADQSKLGAPAAHDVITPSPGPSHSVQFYEDDTFLVAAVVDFLAVGLTTGQPAIVIATEAHRDAFVHGLASEGFDVDAAREAGLLTLLDGRETLAAFMDGDVPDEQRFRTVIGAAIERGIRDKSNPAIRLYGEMVDLLWKDGQTDSAIRLEELWNDLGADYTFSLLCAYAMGNFYKSEDAERFQAVCRQHTHVVPAEGYARASGEARLVEISRLQQRALALEAEIEQRQDLEHRLRDALGVHRRTEAALRERERELREALAERDGLLARERAARADAELARQSADEANSAKSEFLAAMSHELRTPLNAISGHVQLVELGIYGPVTPEQGAALRRVQKSQQHLLSLLNDILNFAKIEAGRVEYNLEDVSLLDAIADVACMVEPQLAARGLAYDVIGASGIVRADRDKLQQILLNLLSNAVKFTEPGGRVTIEASDRTRSDGRIALRVSDTGCGIPAAKHEVIFDPFMQVSARLDRRNEGTGLGLAISRDLARGMGGDLSVSSVEGEGSVFTLVLPGSMNRHDGTAVG
jgi:signal transduction histidine kinase